MYEIGDTLREGRLRKGLTIKDVEDATKIRSKYLQALESDDFEVIPGPTFVRAFLRTYGEFLGLDTRILLDEYRSRFEPAHELHPFPTRAKSTRPSRQQHSRPRSSASGQRNAVVLGVIALIIVAVLAWVGWGNRQRTAVIEPLTTTTSTTTPADTTTTAAGADTATTGAGVTDTTASGAAAVTTTVDLKVKATGGRCYLLVRDGSSTGKQLYAGTLAKGESGHYTSDAALWVNVGQPAALQVTLNGKAATFPGSSGNYLVTATGIATAP